MRPLRRPAKSLTVHTSAGRAFTELILETFRFNGRLLVQGDRLTAPLGLTSARWQVLGAIEHGPLPVAQIVHGTWGSPAKACSELPTASKRRGLFYDPNPNHERAKLVKLSERGLGLVQELAKRQIRWANRIAAVANSEEFDSTVRLMRRLRLRLEAESKASR